MSVAVVVDEVTSALEEFASPARGLVVASEVTSVVAVTVADVSKYPPPVLVVSDRARLANGLTTPAVTLSEDTFVPRSDIASEASGDTG